MLVSQTACLKTFAFLHHMPDFLRAWGRYSRFVGRFVIGYFVLFYEVLGVGGRWGIGTGWSE